MKSENIIIQPNVWTKIDDVVTIGNVSNSKMFYWPGETVPVATSRGYHLEVGTYVKLSDFGEHKSIHVKSTVLASVLVVTEKPTVVP